MICKEKFGGYRWPTCHHNFVVRSEDEFLRKGFSSISDIAVYMYKKVESTNSRASSSVFDLSQKK